MAVIEIARFRLKAGADKAEFIRINQQFQQEIAPTLPGFQRREATTSPTGEWLTVVRFADMESAIRSVQSDNSEISQKFMSLIDPAIMQVDFYEIVSE